MFWLVTNLQEINATTYVTRLLMGIWKREMCYMELSIIVKRHKH